MGDERPTGLALISVHRNLAVLLDADEIINKRDESEAEGAGPDLSLAERKGTRAYRKAAVLSAQRCYTRARPTAVTVVIRPPPRTVYAKPHRVKYIATSYTSFCRGNLTVTTTGTFTFRPRGNSQRRDPLLGCAERCARVGYHRAALRCGLPHRVSRPSRPSLPSFHAEYIPATFHDVNTAVCKTSRTKEVRPSDLCEDAPRCPDEPNKEASIDARWMTGHVGHPRPPSASHAPQTPMFQTKEPSSQSAVFSISFETSETYCSSPASPVQPDPDLEMEVENITKKEPNKRPAVARPSEGSTYDSDASGSDDSDHSDLTDFTTVRRP
ncbi:hypothetical protein EVAR_30732_1 [Eumeta japonica]|uniref:Uncharacterized protein n=1 Tax=Eumeta variegata TaxID=151549 RepID=A0A4C1V6C2_EUMVA|nr:hypothetical protein EVAR_30732_1 [Eumeta japonica]